MFHWWRRLRRKHTLEHHRISRAAFESAVAELPPCKGLTPSEREHLRDQVSLFLAEKAFESVDDFQCSKADRLAIAVLACLPLIHLDFGWYDDWVSVIVYPQEFLVDYEEMDDAGVVHSGRDLRIGEAWDYGPLILSLADVHESVDRHGAHGHGYNVVIHECAHKLDMRNGEANGFPPLHRGMSRRDWTTAFTGAFEDLTRQLAHGHETVIDPYAAESPAECFAVFSEYFFAAPHTLADAYPQVYEQLAAFYRQDPQARI